MRFTPRPPGGHPKGRLAPRASAIAAERLSLGRSKPRTVVYEASPVHLRCVVAAYFSVLASLTASGRGRPVRPTQPKPTGPNVNQDTLKAAAMLTAFERSEAKRRDHHKQQERRREEAAGAARKRILSEEQARKRAREEKRQAERVAATQRDARMRGVVGVPGHGRHGSVPSKC